MVRVLTDIILCQSCSIRVEDALQYLKSLMNSLPIVWWKCTCYHYMRKTRQVTRYRNGDAVPATQVFYERIDTHSAGNVFIYDTCGVKDISKSVIDLERYPLTRIRINRGFVFACMQAAREFEQQRTRFFNENESRDDYMEDISKSVIDLERYPLTRIRINRGFVFACMQAAREFEQQRTRFFNENESRDDYMEVREGMDLSDVCLLEDLLVFRGSPPWFLLPSVFWFFSILLLSWPLRIYAECRTALLNYQVTKLFGTCYLSPSSVNYTGPLTRTSTMETIELEAALRREQYFVVPSYSEAMLMPNATVTLVDPSEARVYSNPIPVNNEQIVLRNYEACDDDVDELPNIRPLRNSRSLNFLQALRRDSIPRMSLGIPLRTSRTTPPRSLSMSGFSGWSSGYHPIGNSSVNDRTPLLDPPDEPPPTYEVRSIYGNKMNVLIINVALRMCAPLYDRLRRSISSRLNSISQSSTKELRNQNDHSNGRGTSRTYNDKDHINRGPNAA
ncbi:hypothetical protein DICVIV_04144 [Dictyocaulus viviparus]|uniref:Uncharacterized protein n=1 Tax=Dictyocaulus viviparus TaxID=29172 RepID=A0A0D8XYM0_DICVI|nr:hypothetical protein DICVIV_04144 [Dictyocaulus viviparus]